MNLTDPDQSDSALAGKIALGCAVLVLLGIVLAVATGSGGPLGMSLAAAVIGGIHLVWWWEP